MLEASASFTTFATEYIRDHKITPGWELPPQIIDQFQAWLGERRIQPDLHEWIGNRDREETDRRKRLPLVSSAEQKIHRPRVRGCREEVSRRQYGDFATRAKDS